MVDPAVYVGREYPPLAAAVLVAVPTPLLLPLPLLLDDDEDAGDAPRVEAALTNARIRGTP